MAFAFLLPASSSAQLESLVMPGKLIEGHAEYETECSNCHKNFEREKQRALCLDCHEAIALDINAGAGFHGKDNKAGSRDCANCHTEHEGRDADIVYLNESRFDHTLTDFELIGKHALASCGDCHEPEVKHRDAPSDCAACHRSDDPHEDTLVDACGDCHSSTDWKEARFDHETTGYSLVGKHQEPPCGDCHADPTFKNTETTCFGCHAEDDEHDGRSGNQCENCHSPQGWDDTRFDHTRDTDFELLGKHAELVCNECHSDEPFADALETGCVSCHLDDDDHDGHHGADCARCHSSETWEVIHFDHGQDTGHALLGAHGAIECNACHVQPIFDVELEGTCVACHEDDDAHKGSEGIACSDCHSESTWEDEVFFDHGLTRFPLLGEHADTQCADCHDSHVFTDAPEQCIDCHRDDDDHNGRFGEACSTCHNPVDWKQWHFDHDERTDFALLGAHSAVVCEGCHRGSLSAQTRLGRQCADCHRNDDIHDGEFGPNCGQCHSADSFREARSLQ